MRASHRLLASTTAAARNSFNPKPTALLPPIPLYRRILRSHRKLPKDQRILGDLYVKAEFRAHQNVENPLHVIGFLSEWQMYAQQIEGESWRESKLDKTKLDKMSDEQIVQLHELMKSVKEVYKEEDNTTPISRK